MGMIPENGNDPISETEGDGVELAIPVENAQVWRGEDEALNELLPLTDEDDGYENLSILVSQEPKEGVEPPSEAPEAAPETAEREPIDQEALQKALAAIKLDRIPEDVIATLTPEQVLKLGGALKERQREINERLSKNKKPDEENDESRQATDGEEPAEPTVPTDLKKLAAEFSEHYGAEGGEVLTKFGRALQRQFEQALSSQTAQLQAAISMAQHALTARVRDQLRESIPQLAKDDDYARVMDQMTVLASTGRYANVAPTIEGRMHKLMRDAAMLTFGAAATPSHPAKPKGNPTAVTRNSSNNTDGLDEEDAVLEMLDKNMTADEIRRSMRGVVN